MRFCPHCGGDLTQYLAAESGTASGAVATTQQKYDQVAVWKELLARANERTADPPSPESLIEAPPAFTNPSDSIIHIAFDRNVVPAGGVLLEAARADGRTSMSIEQLKAMGYSVVDDKVQLVDDVPVGRAYGVIDYWGGAKQHKRWHLAQPVTINPSRSGDPFFMDDNMVAFGARWNDGDKYPEAMLSLLNLFIAGVKNGGVIAVPLAVRVDWSLS